MRRWRQRRFRFCLNGMPRASGFGAIWRIVFFVDLLHARIWRFDISLGSTNGLGSKGEMS